MKCDVLFPDCMFLSCVLRIYSMEKELFIKSNPKILDLSILHLKVCLSIKRLKFLALSY